MLPLNLSYPSGTLMAIPGPVSVHCSLSAGCTLKPNLWLPDALVPL